MVPPILLSQEHGSSDIIQLPQNFHTPQYKLYGIKTCINLSQLMKLLLDWL